MSEFKFACPHCQQHFRCDEEFSGREFQCPSCHMLLHIPAIPGKTAQYQPEVGKTWATFVPSGDVERPKGLSLNRPQKPPPGKS
ncbi:MAG: hypothetical protein ABIR24_07620 [Verrucomicrobiota bacterium]